MLADAALPEGVADVQVNRAELSEAMAVSVNTIDAWLKAGMPFVEKGANGRSYVFQLSDCYAWHMARDNAESDRRQKASESAAQLRMQFANIEEGTRAARLTPREQREIAEAQVSYMRAARERRELIPVDEVQALLETIFSNIRDAAEALPDRLAREAGLDVAQTDRAVIACDDMLLDAQRRITAADMEPKRIDEVVTA